MLTLMSPVPRSSPTIDPSRGMTFPFSHTPPLLPSEQILDLSSCQHNTLSHSEILSKVSSDVFGLASFLERLLRQLLDLDCCQLFLVPVDRQLSWSCDIKLDEICWSSSECKFQWRYTPVGDSMIPDSCSCLHKLSVCHFPECCRCCACLD